MKAILGLILMALLAACAQFGPSPEQAKAMEGSSSSYCIQSLVYGTSHYTTFGGKATGTAGGGGKSTCGASVVEFDNDGKAGKVPAPVAGGTK